MALDATLGGADSNSYLTLDEADTYFEDRLHVDVWDAASDADKDNALVTACRLIEAHRLKVRREADPAFGDVLAPMTPGQALAFPRYGDDGKVPVPVWQAQCEEAIALLSGGEDGDQRANLQAGGVTAFSTIGLSETFGTRLDTSPLLSARARKLIAPFVSRAGSLATSLSPGGEIEEVFL